jgi:hypothetical protein
MTLVVILNVVACVVVLAAVLGLLLRSIAAEHRVHSVQAARHRSPQASKTMARKTLRGETSHAAPAIAVAGPLA